MTIKPAFALPAAAPAPPSPVPPAAPTAPSAPAAPLDMLVGKYRQVRDRKKEIAARHSAELKPFNEALQELEVAILDALNKAGVESVKTREGTAFKSTRRSFTVQDPAKFRKWLEEHDRFDLLETRVSKEAIEEMIRAGDNLPPGIGVSSDITVNVRK